MQELTSRERLDRCYRHLEVDRPGLYLRGATSTSPPHPSYGPLRELAAARSDLKFNGPYGHLVPPLDCTESTEPYSEEFERHVSILHTPAGDLRASYLAGLQGQPGMPEEHFIKTEADAEKYLSLPLQEVGGDTSAFFDLDREVGDRGIVEVHLGLNPAGHVAEILGSTNFALFTLEHRDVLHALMEHKQRQILHLLDYLIGSGVGPYFAILGQEYVAPPLHGPDDFYEFNVLYDRPIADRVHDADGLFHVHCHGPLGSVLPGFVDLGADVLHPIEPPPMGDVTPERAKAVLRDKVCIEGNVQIGDMYTDTADEIRAKVTALIEAAFDDGKGLIVCPSASPYVPEMTEQCYENYAALVDVVTNWRGG